MSVRSPAVLLTLAATLAAIGPASSAEFSGCGDPLAKHLPVDPALCLKQADVQAPLSARNAAVHELFVRSEVQAATGYFDGALATLACAEAIAGTDAALRYELVRRHGIIEFRRERIPQALRRFECAVELADARGDHIAEARDLKNVGAALRRLGDFQGALRTLTASLEMQRATGEVSGAVYNNLGDVYRELEEPQSAMRYYRKALAAFQAKGERIEAAHVLESMAEQALDTGDAALADTWLQQALNAYRDEKNKVYELRAHDGLTRAALARGDIAVAQRWISSAQAIAAEGGLAMPLALQWQVARTERLSGRANVAVTRVQEALAAAAEGDPDRQPLLEELAAAQSDLGQHQAANESLRRAYAEGRELSRAQHNRQLDWLRLRFETSERDRTIAVLEHRNRVRTLQMWGALVSGLAIALGGWLLLDRRRQRQRLDAETRRIRLEEELARYRREADALAEDRDLLQTLLDSREDATCLLDADGMVLAANRAACSLLGVAADDLVGQPMATFLGANDDGAGLEPALERMEDSAAHILDVVAQNGTPLRARMAQWAGGSGRLVLGLSPCVASASVPHLTATASEAPGMNDLGIDTCGGEETDAVVRDAFRRALVELMLAAIEAWESATASSRIELAEKSRIWRVNIDDGRLRARAMERYLGVSKLPRNPRWRDVLRTAYYVLGQCPGIPEGARSRLQGRVEIVLAYTRRDAMV